MPELIRITRDAAVMGGSRASAISGPPSEQSSASLPPDGRETRIVQGSSVMTNSSAVSKDLPSVTKTFVILGVVIGRRPARCR
jgi:hypothetical protein